MATSEPQKQLLTLIRGFATENSQGERRVVGLQKRIDELQAELDGANAGLENVKSLKETTEQELKGYEVELTLSDASIQALEARVSQTQDDVVIVGYNVEALKDEEGATRDEFISQMSEFNLEIRKFQEIIACTFCQEDQSETSSGQKNVSDEDTEIALKAPENEFANIISQIKKEKQDYEEEQNICKQVKQELIDSERKLSLMKAIMKETKELQDLKKQTSELEEECGAAREELQRRCFCPSCRLDNVETLGVMLLINEEN